MSYRNTFLNVAFAFVLILLQVTIFRNMTFFNVSFCFLYVGVVLLLPVRTPVLLAMGIGFGVGLLVDMFYNTAGMHAAGMVFLAWIRRYFFRWLEPTGGYEEYDEVSFSSLGWGWYFSYAAPLILIHHVAIFVIEYLQADLFLPALWHSLLSLPFSLIVMMMVQYVFFPRASRY